MDLDDPVTNPDSLPFAVRQEVRGYVLPDHILPENTNEALKFPSRDEATRAVQARFTGWIGCKDDDTMPENDQHRRAWVLRLKLAMKDRDNLVNKGYTDRWAKDKPYQYDDEAMEKVCWDIVHRAEQLHLHGLRDFPIYDEVMYKNLNLKKDSQLTFQERMELLITNFC
jgi:hypothetical protein